MTHTLATYDLAGSVVMASVPWQTLSYTHVLNGPGSMECRFSMTDVDRSDVEPGQRDYRVLQGATPRAAGRLWRARVDTAMGSRSVRAIGEGTAGILARRLVNWESRYEPITESPTNLNTVYAVSQEDILFDLIDRTQAEAGGDLGITLGTHTGGSHLRRRWYCAEDGVFLADVFDDFAGLTDGLDWAITPTLSDSSLLEFATWNPSRGSDLSGSIVLDGSTYLDNFTYEVDASQIVTHGRSTGEGDCEPPAGEDYDNAALAEYGLLEDFEPSNSDHQDDASETALALLSPKPVVGADVWYQLSNGPALGAFDVGDVIRLTDTRPGWTLDLDVRVQEIEVVVQLPDDDDHTFVRVNWTEAFAESSS